MNAREFFLKFVHFEKLIGHHFMSGLQKADLLKKYLKMR